MGYEERRGVGRTALRCWAAVLLGVVAVLGFGVAAPSPAWAHAVLVAASPQNGAVLDSAPSQVTLTFSEPVRPVAGQIRVYAPDGSRTDHGEPATSDTGVRVGLHGAGEGSYLVTFRVISADGHPVSGAFSYAVGAPSVLPSVDRGPGNDPVVFTAMPVVRVAGFAGLLLLIGAAGMLLLPRPVPASRTVAGRLAWLGAAGVAVSTLCALPLQVPHQFGGGLGDIDAAGLGEVFASRFGYAHLVRLALLAAALPLLRTLVAAPSSGSRRAALVGLGLAALVTWPVSGHPSASPLPWLSMVADVAHLAAMSVWLGGLAVLAILLLRRTTQGELEDLLPGWSRLAMGAVAVLVLAGVTQAVIEVGTLPALTTTRYGLLVLTKAGLLAVILAVAYFSRRLVRRNGSPQRRRGCRDTSRRLRRAQPAPGGVVGSPGYNTGIRANLRLAGRRLDSASLDPR
ncbi:MAG: copper resistance CopC/CopD family protein, partial [Micromonosporaceae bacterium]